MGESHVANSKVTCVKSLQKFSQNVGCYNPSWIGKLRNPNDGVHFQETYRWCSYHQLEKTWEKLMLAARAIATIENPEDVFVVSSRPYGQRAVLKFARYIGTSSMAGRYTPGSLTNQIQSAFKEPRLLVVADPRSDHQPVTEASYANVPVIAFANVDSPTRFIDIAIPCNNEGDKSIGLMWWFLAREVLRLRGSISRELQWDVMPDLFFYRNPEEAEKEEQARQEALAAQAAAASAQQQPPKQEETDWGTQEVTDWANEPAPGMGAGAPGVAAAAAPKYQVNDDWSAQQAPVQASDWAAESTGQPQMGAGAAQWGGSSNWA